MSHNITVEGGTSVRLPTAGKYCDRDIIITAEGGAEDLNDVLTEQEELIAELQEVLKGKAAGGGADPVIEPLEIAENGTYTAPSGVDGYSPIEVNVPIPDGYIVPSGTKTITENGTHDAREYESVDVNVPIPDGYIIPSGTLDITENGTHDVTEYASVNVNVAAGGGGITADQIATGTIEGNLSISANKVNPYAFYGNGKITEVSAPDVTSLGSYAFYNCGGLTSVYFPNATSVGEYAFQSCGIVEIEFPSLLTIPNGCFRYSGKIKKGTFPNVTSVGENAFRGDSRLQQLDFSVCATIYQLAFISCTNLNVIIFRSPTVITLKNSNAFSSTPIASGTGYVYVPSALVDSYKTATNWSTYANQFRAIEDYPEITGG